MLSIEAHRVCIGAFNTSFSLERNKINYKNTFYPIKKKLLDFFRTTTFFFDYFCAIGIFEFPFCHN